MLRKLVVTFLALYPASASAAQPDYKEEIRIATDRIADIMIDENISAVSVAIAVNGEIAWAEGFGLADRENGRKANKDTAHSIASITKPFTATAIMQLAEQGKIDLDAPINDYLGENKLVSMVESDAAPTVRQILNHTSGLAYHHAFFYEDETPGRLGHEESIRRFGKLIEGPGKTFRYTNFGYGLLDYAVTRVSGKPYARYLQDEIFSPLALDNTFIPQSAPNDRNAAVRYRPGGKAAPFYDFDHRGAAAIYSSAEDLAGFGLAFLDALKGESTLLSEDSAHAMIAAPVEAGGGRQYGLGWQIRPVNDRLLVSHSGAMTGTRANLIISPQDAVVIAVAFNADNASTKRVTDMLIQLFAPEMQNPEARLALAEAMNGSWAGVIELGGKNNASIRLDIDEAGSVNAVLNNEKLRLAEIDQQAAGYFTLLFHDGELPMRLAARYPHRLALTIRPRGARITGYASTKLRPQADRLGSSLNFTARLRRIERPTLTGK